MRVREIIYVDESKRLLRSAERPHCKIYLDETIERIFMKMAPANSPQFFYFAELFPKIRFFFNTRHPEHSAKSIKQVLDSLSDTLYFKFGFARRELAAADMTIPYGNKYLYDHVRQTINKWKQNLTTDGEADELICCFYLL